MLSPQALFKGIVSRILPSANADLPNVDVPTRFSRYGENYTIGMVRKQHALADEGCYFTANNAQTAITGQAIFALDLTKPSIVLFNADTVGGAQSKRIYLDYISLVQGATAYSNATSNTMTYCHIATDSINRYSSAGTQLTVRNVNQDSPISSTVGLAYAGAIVTTTASALRHLSGYRIWRFPVSGTAQSLANVDRWMINFGGVENVADPQLLASATVEATAVSRAINFPPVVIGPGQSFLFYITPIANSAAVGGTLHYELGWWER